MSALFPCGPGVQPVAALSFHGPKGQRAGDREVMSVFLGEAESRRCRLLDDTALYAHARALADQLLPGVAAGAEPFALVRRDEAIPVHAVGRYRMAAALERQQSGPVVFAGDYLATATVDGALRTGLAAAAALERAGRTRASA
jgi:predicted NAD/FAD-dependent oxidoreductase